MMNETLSFRHINYSTQRDWHNVALPAHLCRLLTDDEVKQYRFKLGMQRHCYAIPNDEVMEWFDQQGIEFHIDQCFPDLCSFSIRAKHAPAMKLRFDLSDRHI